MIATHDTFTYCKCKNPVINLFKRWWRCQDIHVTGQIRRGAGYLDVRIRLRDQLFGVVVCHGLADMKGMEFHYIHDLLAYLDKFNVMYRLVLERGCAEDGDFFSETVTEVRDSHPLLMWAVIKKGWKTVFMRDGHPRIADLCLHWDGKTVLKSVFRNAIRENAKKVVVTRPMRDDRNTVYFLDYWKGGA